MSNINSGAYKSVGISYNSGEFTFSYGFGVTRYTKHYATGNEGTEIRNSFMVNYDNGKTGFSLGTNFWGGMYSQRTGIFGVKSGDFSMSYENDGAPFGTVLGDNHDRWRTAAMTIGIGKFNAGFNLFTGERYSDSYEEATPPGKDAETMSGREKLNRLGRILKPFPQADDGGFGARLPFGLVEEKGTRYRFGGAYIGWGSYRAGIDSDRYVRHPIQDILAHYIISPQPGFQTLSNGINPYFQYQTRNQFTSW